MGRMNARDMDLLHQKDDFWNQPPRIYAKPEDLLAKEVMTKFFVRDMPKNLLFYKMEGEYTIYHPNPVTKIMEVEVNSSLLSPNQTLFMVGLSVSRLLGLFK